MSVSQRRGSREPAWTHFVDGLRAFVARRVPAQDAEDVAQEALLRVHRGIGALRDPRRTQGWVYAIARYAVADYYRGRQPDHEVADDASAWESLADPTTGVREKLAVFAGDHSVHEEVLTWFRPMAEALPDGYRQALLLADFEGWSQRRVAAELGLSLPGAKSRIQRARKMLAAELEQCCKLELGSDGKVEDFERHGCDC